MYYLSEKEKYSCKYCGLQYPKLNTLTALNCAKHPNIGVAALALYMYIKKRDNGIEGKEYDVLTFSDVLDLSKKLIDKNGAIPQNQKLVLLKMGSNYVITFYDEIETEVISGTTILIKCKDLDENLRLAFGDKNMIVIKE